MQANSFCEGATLVLSTHMTPGRVVMLAIRTRALIAPWSRAAWSVKTKFAATGRAAEMAEALPAV